MADLDWPADISPFQAEFYLQPHTGGTESPFTRQTKVYGLSAPRWICRISLRAPDSADRWGSDYAEWGERIDAFLASLEGRLNRVRLWDFRREGRTPTFSNAAIAQGDTEVRLVGATAGDIRVGEYIGGDGRPHIITGLAVSGSDLIATVKPPFDAGVTAGGAWFEQVSGTFRLTSDDAGANMASVGELTQYDLEFVEDTAEEPLPLGPITLPAAFNNTLAAEPSWNGSAISFATNPYDLIDFTLTETVNHYYVNWTTGNNADAGTSSALAWKTLAYAITNAVSPAVIHLEDDYIGVGSLVTAAGKTYSGKLKIIGGGPTNGRTLIVGRRESENLASFAWAASGSAGAYVSVAAAARYYRAQFDGNIRDAKGFPTPITNAGSIAACQSTPGTFYWDATNADLYVHMADGRIPDPDDGWIYCESSWRLELQQSLTTSAGVILLENLEAAVNSGTASTGTCFRYRPVTTGSANSARFGMKNCLAYGASTNAIEIYDADVTALENCHAAYCRTDGLNYHSFVTTNPDGEFITIYEHNCSARDCGFTGWADQSALSASSNGSTSHDALHILRTNGAYSGCNGAVVADVNGVVSVNLNCSAESPIGTANPKACFWHSGTGVGANYGMYLWGCSAADNGDATVILLDSSGTPNAESNGQIYVEHWRGQLAGAVIGTLKDWDGNVLASLADAA